MKNIEDLWNDFLIDNWISHNNIDALFFYEWKDYVCGCYGIDEDILLFNNDLLQEIKYYYSLKVGVL